MVKRVAQAWAAPIAKAIDQQQIRNTVWLEFGSDVVWDCACNSGKVLND